MFDEVLAPLASAKEWGLIMLFVAVFCIIIRYIIRANIDRDKVSGEREAKLMAVMVRFSDNIPQLAAAIKELRDWLGDKFTGVEEGLDDLQKSSITMGDKILNHENRIAILEDDFPKERKRAK